MAIHGALPVSSPRPHAARQRALHSPSAHTTTPLRDRPSHIPQPQPARAARRAVLSLTTRRVAARRFVGLTVREVSGEHHRRASTSVRRGPRHTHSTPSAHARITRPPDPIALTPPPPRAYTSLDGRTETVTAHFSTIFDGSEGRGPHRRWRGRGRAGARHPAACSVRAHSTSGGCCRVCCLRAARSRFRTHRERAVPCR